LPRLIQLYERFQDRRDRFEILAFHDTTARSFAELDPKLAQLEKAAWQGKPLPFPILLDATGETLKRYGVQAFPTCVLIDPDGKLVGSGSEEMLVEALESGR
jgi:hypothetical protein